MQALNMGHLLAAPPTYWVLCMSIIRPGRYAIYDLGTPFNRSLLHQTPRHATLPTNIE
jgi:hypothetical protein